MASIYEEVANRVAYEFGLPNSDKPILAESIESLVGPLLKAAIVVAEDLRPKNATYMGMGRKARAGLSLLLSNRRRIEGDGNDD